MNLILSLLLSIWINYGNELSFNKKPCHPRGDGSELSTKLWLEIGESQNGIKFEYIHRAGYRVTVDTNYIGVLPAEGVENILTLSYLRNLKVKNFDILFNFGLSSFTYGGPLYPGLQRSGSATNYLIAPAICLRKRIKNMNLLLDTSINTFYTIIRNKKTYSFNGYLIFFGIGCVLKE
ncbi:MAG: hypothetical protein ABIM29_03760 [candidate division WOR-3 bacterium]